MNGVCSPSLKISFGTFAATEISQEAGPCFYILLGKLEISHPALSDSSPEQCDFLALAMATLESMKTIGSKD